MDSIFQETAATTQVEERMVSGIDGVSSAMCWRERASGFTFMERGL